MDTFQKRNTKYQMMFAADAVYTSSIWNAQLAEKILKDLNTHAQTSVTF